MYQSYLISFLLKSLFHYVFFLFFLVSCNNDLFIPVLIVNNKVKEAPVIPSSIPNTAACVVTLKVPNDADKVIKILSRQSRVTILYLIF